LDKVGVGTQRLEAVLAEHFPDKQVLRIDRDNTRKKGALAALLDTIHDNSADIIIGTQMIAKGHHFSNLTLVAIVDADTGLLGSDFRALERLGQLYIQVAGRAGRECRQGEVVLQTHQPQHPLLQLLLNKGYFEFIKQLMRERELLLLPPFAAIALFRAEAAQPEKAEQFLKQIKEIAAAFISDVQLMGPIAAPMQRKAGMYRAQLLLRAKERKQLHALLRALMPKIIALKQNKRIRWSLDVDTQEMF
jgi:primosomal protein N' (replication factor Y) (superfamily II helicase)